MASLTNEAASACCAGDQQAACCGPAQKDACCSPESTSCGCAAGRAQEADDVRERVRERYAAAALAAGTGGCGCGSQVSQAEQGGTQAFGGRLYAGAERSGTSENALEASLGCGVPTAVADLKEGETVLDLGSGAGADVLISARRVAPTGKAIGLDMTDEMLELARRHAEEAGIENVEFRKGYIEDIPLPDASVDVVISNSVLNLSGDKPKVLREAARVLRPGGRFAISDVIAAEDMDDETRVDMRRWTGCIAGALTRREFEEALADAGLEAAEIRETHRVHEHADAAIIRARKPRLPATAGSGWRPAHEIDLPMAPDCALDDTGLGVQLERYRRVGNGASLIEQTSRRLSVELDARIDGQLIDELLAIERECCAFLAPTWQPDERRLTFAVSSAEHEPVLEGISLALGLTTPTRP